MMTDVEPGLVDAVSTDVLADQQAAFEVAFVAFGLDVVFPEAGLINLLWTCFWTSAPASALPTQRR